MKIIKVLTLAGCLMLPAVTVNSQDDEPAKTSIYLELFGSGGSYSVNLERQIIPKLYIRIGAGFYREFTFLGRSDTFISAFPVMIGFLSGSGKNHFEIAGGMLFGNSTVDHGTTTKIRDAIAFIGYRYQKPEGGFVFRAGFTPFFSLDNDANFPNPGYSPSVGLSVGLHL